MKNIKKLINKVGKEIVTRTRKRMKKESGKKMVKESSEKLYINKQTKKPVRIGNGRKWTKKIIKK